MTRYSSRPHRVPKCLGCPVLIRYIFPSIREHQTVEIHSEVRSIDVRHCPHRSNHTWEPAVLDGCCKVESLVSDAFFCELRGITSLQERKSSCGKLTMFHPERLSSATRRTFSANAYTSS